MAHARTIIIFYLLGTANLFPLLNSIRWRSRSLVECLMSLAGFLLSSPSQHLNFPLSSSHNVSEEKLVFLCVRCDVERTNDKEVAVGPSGAWVAFFISLATPDFFKAQECLSNFNRKFVSFFLNASLSLIKAGKSVFIASSFWANDNHCESCMHKGFWARRHRRLAFHSFWTHLSSVQLFHNVNAVGRNCSWWFFYALCE